VSILNQLLYCIPNVPKSILNQLLYFYPQCPKVYPKPASLFLS
jgi:hypothetical protein